MRISIEHIPDSLVKETINGRKYYYKNYRNVLENQSSPESVMGSSELQATIVSILFYYLSHTIDWKIYKIVVSEPGLHLSANTNFSNDIAIYEKSQLPDGRDLNKYFSVSPRVAIEVDINIETSEQGEDDFSYMFEKSKLMINAGTLQVIWVLSNLKSSLIFESSSDGSVQPRVVSWDKPFFILSNIPVKISEWIIERGESSLLESIE